MKSSIEKHFYGGENPLRMKICQQRKFGIVSILQDGFYIDELSFVHVDETLYYRSERDPLALIRIVRF